MRNIVIFDDQSCIESVWQGSFIFKYSILDRIWGGIDWPAFECLAATSYILNIFLTLGVLQKSGRRDDCNNGDFIKHVLFVYI
jgi:hypothetical protein